MGTNAAKGTNRRTPSAKSPSSEPSLTQAGVRGGISTAGAQAIRFAIGLGSATIIARILSPEDFGIVAMVIAFVGVAEVLRDFGLYSAAIQAPTLSRAQKSNLFWANLVLGAFTSLAVFLAAPFIAEFYGAPETADIARAIAPLFAINAAAAQFRAMITRDLRFVALNSVGVVSQLVGAICGIWAALAGWEYWALILQQLANATAMLLLAVIIARWFPGLPAFKEQMDGLWAFGGAVLGQQLLNYGVRNVDSIAIGRVWGPSALGQYDRAYQTLMIPIGQINTPLTQVAVPLLSRVQSNRDHFARKLVTAQSVALYVTVPVFGLFVAAGPEILVTLFGPQWQFAGTLLRFLAIGGIFRSLMQATYWGYLATAKMGVMLRFDLIALPLLAGVILAGLPFGPLGVAVTHSAGYAVYWFVGLLWMCRALQISARPLLAAASRSLLIVTAPGSLLAFAVTLAPGIPAWLSAILAAVVALGWSALITLAWRRTREELFTLLRPRKNPTVAND